MVLEEEEEEEEDACWCWRGHVKRDRTRRDILIKIRRFQEVFTRRKWQEEGWEDATGYEGRIAVGASLLPPFDLAALFGLHASNLAGGTGGTMALWSRDQ